MKKIARIIRKISQKVGWSKFRNWRLWVYLPYLLAVWLFVVIPIASIRFICEAIIKAVDYIDYNDADICYLKKAKAWIDKGRK